LRKGKMASGFGNMVAGRYFRADGSGFIFFL
jgi:hypothetical protein